MNDAIRSVVEQIRVAQVAQKAAEDKAAVDRMKVWDDEVIKRTNAPTSDGQKQPAVPAPRTAPEQDTGRYEGVMIQGGNDKYGNLNGTDESRRALARDIAAERETATIGPGLIKRNLNRPIAQPTMADSTPVYNPYYDSGTGMAKTNPYLQGRQKRG
jgi:hypothetical protein